MDALTAVLTDAGLRAVFNADRDGLQATITHIAFGDEGYAPTGAEAALANERVRVPVSGGSWVADFVVHVTSLLDDGPSFWIRECGIFLSDGTMLAVWSDAARPLAYKTEGVPIVTAFDLALERLPAGSVTVQAGDIDLSLFFAAEFAQLATGIIDNQHRHINQSDDLAELRRRIASLEYRAV